MFFYSNVWRYRNESFYNPGKYRVHVIEWYNRIDQDIESGNRSEMKKYLCVQRLNLENCSSSYIKKWNITTMDMIKRTKKEVVSDIRIFFALRSSD